ncbi:MAG: serine/threonine-protein kinase, partial [Acidobacteriota bacterium]
MANQRMFVQGRETTPSLTRSAPVGLPPDLLEAASQRLSLAALLYAFAYSVSFLIGRFTTSPQYESFEHSSVGDVAALVSVSLSLAVFWLARSGRLDPQFLLDIGLIYWVVSAAGIDFGFYWALPPGFPVVGISWVCVWLVLFPLIVPSSPGKTLLAALMTATVGPLLFFMSLVFRGNPMPDGVYMLNLFVPYYICAGLAFVGSAIIYKLGCDVTRAREMGSYKLIELLGRGGIGEVWLAKHRLLARPAAIKLLNPQVLGSTADGSLNKLALKRFEREAQATAALGSPHTIRLYDFGTTEEGSFYYAMELLDGFDLESLVTRFGPVSPARAVDFLIQACDSLADAHHHGLIHRDIKPSNIYVCRLGIQFDFIKVLDFGLVKLDHDPSGQATQLTREGLTTGTPAYLSPEVALGQGEVDARTDIYSLGCVAYWLVTGQLVFKGDPHASRSGSYSDHAYSSLATHRAGDSFGAGTNYSVLSGEEAGKATANGLGTGGKTGGLRDSPTLDAGRCPTLVGTEQTG